ncbi:tyrosinase family protein [Brasilonema sp. UFV-L1]|uniref:tyrosinase family protein n=1 Tax=Brasilonema sp. UFV-L1 TaxID=2234130 RepID=UPI00145C8BCA
MILVVFTTVSTLLAPSQVYAQSVQPNTQPAQVAQIQFTRSSVFSDKGKKDLDSLVNALAKMRALACENPKSWYYQGAIHWVPSLTKFPQSNSLCSKYTQIAFNDPQQKLEVQKLLNAWQHCTHGLPDQNLNLPISQIADQHFLPWHRLYLIYFEKIVRKLSPDNPQFAIPYWDYTRADQRTIPSQFVTTSSSLYTNLRNSVLNFVGGAVESSKQQQIKKDKNNAYGADSFNQTKNPLFNFSNQINNSPHGEMHGYIGGVVGNVPNPIWNNQPSPDGNFGLMTDVETAGFDPIFWIHHSNIDRYWESWQAVNPEKRKATVQDLSLPSNLAQIYTFADENNNLVSYNTPANIIKGIYSVDYQYDQLDPDAKTAVVRGRVVQSTQLSAREALQPRILAVKQQLHQSLDKLTDVTVPLSTPLQKRLVSSEARTVTTPVQPEQYLLEVKLSFTKRPIGNYNVYVNLPRIKSLSSVISDIEHYYVGSVNFFELHNAEENSKTFVFDITNEVNTQLSELTKPQVENIEVKFVSDSIAPKEEIYIENITLSKPA